MAGLNIDITADDRRLLEALRRSGVRIEDFSRTAQREGTSVEKMFKRIAVSAMGAWSTKELLSNIIQVRGETQQLEIAFTTMLKSQEKSAKLMQDLTKFASETPFGLQSSASGAKQLLAYGSQAENIIDELRMLGDVASGTGQQINDLVYLYGTLRVQGRAYLMDIRQFAGRGIPIYDELAKVLNVSKDRVNDLVSAGKVGFKEVEQAFKNMTTSGGLYGGLMEEQSKSITGRIEQLKDAVDVIYNNIGASSEGVIYTAIDGLTVLAENYETIGKILLELVATYGIYRGAVIALSVIENIRYQATLAQMAGMTKMQVVTDVLRKKTEALNATLAKNPYVLAGIAVAGLAYGIYKLSQYQTDLDKSQTRLNKSAQEYTEGVEREAIQIDILFDKLQNAKEGTEQYQKAKDDIISKYGSYLTGLSKEIQSLNDIEGAYKAISKAAIQSAKDRAIASGTENAVSAYTNKWGDNLKKIQDKFKGEFGEVQADILLDSLKNSLKDGGELSSEVKDAINKFTKTVHQQQGQFGGVKTFETNAVQELVDQIIESKDILEKEVKSLDSIFGESSKNNETPEIFKFIGKPEQIKEAREEVSKLASELKNIKNGIKPSDLGDKEQFDFAKGIEEKVKQLKEAQNRLDILLYGKTTTDLNKSSKDNTNSITDQQDKLNELLKKQALERARLNQDLENQEIQASISAMKDSAEKRAKQRELNNRLEIQALERQKEDYIHAEIQKEKELFDAREDLKAKQDKKYHKQLFDSSNIKVDTTAFDNIITDTTVKQTKEYFNSILGAYQDFETQRKAINDKFDADLTFLESQPQNEATERAIEQLKKQWKEALSAISLDEFQDSINWDVLFSNLDGVSTKALKELREKVQYYLSEVGDDLTKQDFKAVADALEDINEKLADRTPFQELSQGINEYKQATDDLAKSKALAKISQSINSMGRQGSEMVSSMSELMGMLENFGVKFSDQLKGSLEGVGQIMSGLEKMDFTKPMSIVTGAVSVLSGLGNTIASAFGFGGADYSNYNKMKEQYDYLNDIWDSLISKKKEYIKISYGDEAYKAGKEALELAEKSLESYRILGLERLNSGASAGSHSIGRRIWKNMSNEGWKQAKDALGSFWDDSFDDKGRMEWLFKLSTDQIAKLKEADVFWAKLDGDVRDYLEGIISGQERIEEIHESVKEQLTQTSFDNVRDSFLNTLSDMSSSASDFADDFTSYMQKAILNTKLAELMDNELRQWYDDFAEYNKDGTISDSEYSKLQSQWDNIVQKGLAEREKLQSIFGWDSSDNVQASSKGIASMSQDSANELNGNFFALLNTSSEIRNINREGFINVNGNMVNIKSIMEQNSKIFQDSLNVQKQIANNTFRTAEILDRIETKGLNVGN